MKTKSINVNDAVGVALAQDITQVIPGNFKGVRFKVGHVIAQADVAVLLDCGKRNIYVLEPEERDVMENPAAERTARVCAGDGVNVGVSKEGRCDILASADGLLKVDRYAVNNFNAEGRIFLSTLHDNTPVKVGEVIAAVKVIPLFVDESEVQCIEELIAQPVFTVLPYKAKRVGVVVTGSEVASGRIKDGFGDIIANKLAPYGSVIAEKVVVTDNVNLIIEQVRAFQAKYDMVIVTGGMSVDPDDVTPTAIRACAQQVIIYGTPILPGGMFMLAYANSKPLVGFPACGMFAKATAFDVLLPRLLSDDVINESEIRVLGYGGLCRKCEQCHYPVCSFALS